MNGLNRIKLSIITVHTNFQPSMLLEIIHNQNKHPKLNSYLSQVQRSTALAMAGKMVLHILEFNPYPPLDLKII